MTEARMTERTELLRHPTAALQAMQLTDSRTIPAQEQLVSRNVDQEQLVSNDVSEE